MLEFGRHLVRRVEGGAHRQSRVPDRREMHSRRLFQAVASLREGFSVRVRRPAVSGPEMLWEKWDGLRAQERTQVLHALRRRPRMPGECVDVPLRPRPV